MKQTPPPDTTLSQDLIRNKVNAINAIGEQLKTEFSGIDKQIDLIIRYVTPFYATPELLTRPVVVCLWGMTGVGKTHLLRRLSELMHMQSRYVTFDMGEYAGGFSEYTLRYQLDDVADNVPGGRAMIVFDEMQVIRFIDEAGNEVDRPAARLIWSVLDGEPLNRNTNFTNNVLDTLKKFKRLKEQGVKVAGNRVTYGLNFFKKVIRRWKDEDEEDKTSWVFTESDFELMYRANPSAFNYNEDAEHWLKFFEEFTEINEFVQFLEKVNEGCTLGRPSDLSKSLIFCVGNLDEVYQDSHGISPDINIEALREYTEKVTLVQVKNALLNRFRPEQIARLGNNHVIYPSLDRASYWNIINKHVDNSLTRVKTNYNIELDIDDSVLELIFNESVFPTQGARPVNNAFGILFDSYLAEAVCNLPGDDRISWSYDDSKRQYIFVRGESTHIVDVQLLVESQRDNEETDKQAVVAVHESGHAIAYTMYMNKWPTEIRSRTAGFNGGYVMSDALDFKTRDDIIALAKYGIAGVVAEEIIFGASHVSNGATNDFSSLTRELHQAITQVCLFKESWIGSQSVPTGLLADESSVVQVNNLVKQMINTAYHEVVKDLTEQKHLLLKVAEHLINHTAMSSEKFASICESNGLTIANRFSHREALLTAIRAHYD
jgi:hypothetical protein